MAAQPGVLIALGHGDDPTDVAITASIYNLPMIPFAEYAARVQEHLEHD
jgi:hypothetical protein